MNYKIISDDGINKIVFNGIIYLAKNRHFSKQFLGSGQTASEAYENMTKTINKIYFKNKGEI